MPDDPTQQQQSGLPPWISRAGSALGSGLSTVGSGLGAALPYALPAALGAGMGALSGQGAGATALGGVAGALSAKGVQSEEEIKQQQLHLEAQKADIEIQKGRLALDDDKEKDEYAKKNITPELAKLSGMSVETLRRMYKDKPEDYFQTIGMANWAHTVSQTPGFVKQYPDVAAAIQSGMPPEISAKVIGKLMDRTYSGKSQVYKKDDGSYAYDVYNPKDPADKVAIPLEGTPVSTTNIELRAENKPFKTPTASVLQGMALKAKTEAAKGSMNFGGINWMGLTDDQQQQVVRSNLINQLTASGATDEQAEKLAGPAIAAAFPSTKPGAGGAGAAPPPPAALPPTTGVAEGTRKFNPKTGQYIILKGGAWASDG